MAQNKTGTEFSQNSRRISSYLGWNSAKGAHRAAWENSAGLVWTGLPTSYLTGFLMCVTGWSVLHEMAIFPAAVTLFNPNNSRSFNPFCKYSLLFPIVSFSLHTLGKLHIFPLQNMIFNCIWLLNFLSMNFHFVHFKHSF